MVTNDEEVSAVAKDDGSLLAEFRELWAEADNLWDQYQETPAFHGYVSADYYAVYQSLLRLEGTAATLLEWGSGLGIVAIMASRMGFEAYGIEAEPSLVEHAERLAQFYGSAAQFAQGSFIPEEFEWDLIEGDESQRTLIDIPAAYESLDMELRDFDLIYAYPWPEEHTLFRNIVRSCGQKNALFLSYDGREGMELIRSHDP